MAAHAGYDADGDGVLDDDEIVLTTLLCDPPPELDTGAAETTPGADTGAEDTGAPVEPTDTPDPACTLYGTATITNALDVALLSTFCRITGDLDVIAPGLPVAELPLLEVIDGALVVHDNVNVTVDLPAIRTVGHLSVRQNAAMTTVLAPALVEVDSIDLSDNTGGVYLDAGTIEVLPDLVLSENGATELWLPALVEVEDLFWGSSANLVAGAFPALASAATIEVELDDANDVALELPSLTSVNDLLMTETGIGGSEITLDAPLLVEIGGDLTISTYSPQSVSLPSLDLVGGTVWIGSGNTLQSFEVPALREVGSFVSFGSTLTPDLAVHDLPALEIVHGQFHVWERSVSAPLLATVENAPGAAATGLLPTTDAIFVSACGLETVDLSGLTSVGGEIGLAVADEDGCDVGTTVFDVSSLTGHLVGRFDVYFNPYSTTGREGVVLAPGVVSVPGVGLHGLDSRSDLGALQEVDGDLQMNSEVALPSLNVVTGVVLVYGGSVDLPVLASVGSFYLTSDETIEHLALPSLVSIDGLFQLWGNDLLATLDLPILASAGEVRVFDNDMLPQFALPSLANVDGLFELEADAVLATLDLPALASVGGDLTIVDNPALCKSQVDVFLATTVVVGAQTVSGIDPGC